MRIEHLFSKLESKTSLVFSKIRDAVSKNLEHIDILEKDVQTLFSFMSISPRRSQQYINSIQDVRRENDFLWKDMEDEYAKGGRQGDTREVWLAQLLYHLEHSHEDLLADAAENVTARTYKHFVETFALQIWKAADGYELFLNDSLVDFEGDTEYGLGMRTKEMGPELIWTTKEHFIHLVLPISPEVAVIFCDESRCWESPFANMMHRANIPFPANSLLARAPHKDIVDVHVPERKRSRGTWPATTAWRVSIGTLSREQHSIIASYSLSHATAVLVVRSREKFEKAKKELEVFSEEQAKRWKTQGISFTDPANLLPRDASNPSRQIINKVVDEHEAALVKIMGLIDKGKPLRRTRENTYASWLAIRTLRFMSPHASTKDANTAIKIAFEAAYPPQHPQHRKLLTVDFMTFYNHGIDDETFSRLSFAIDTKIREVMAAETFSEHWSAASADEGKTPAAEPLAGNATLMQKPAFQSVVRGACGFEILSWMFEERQDILATFIEDLAVRMHELQPQVTRVRGIRM